MKEDVINKFLDFILKDTGIYEPDEDNFFAVLGRDNKSILQYMIYNRKTQNLNIMQNFFDDVLKYVPYPPKFVLKSIVNYIEQKYDVKIKTAITFYFKGNSLKRLNYNS